ncbi:MAG TPA: hypothetical protein QF355_08585 [Candidatus Marinimicrobia bacterium]|nr:hypothetical protein [SAR324 cluster bacterium]MDP7171503.1 hypothetical protein [SAR324 cluster bacterium]MDP7176582.1 hypothetical protein [SAR324 cluster bacterium]MDP7439007.1 hypothetical protein [SAR324 cluster bacterium]HJL79341.1 hypothetical protein [Candidatus Neomarinimicrobiota bacterium]
MTRIAQSIRTFRFMTEYVIAVVVIYLGKIKTSQGNINDFRNSLLVESDFHLLSFGGECHQKCD